MNFQNKKIAYPSCKTVSPSMLIVGSLIVGLSVLRQDRWADRGGGRYNSFEETGDDERPRSPTGTSVPYTLNLEPYFGRPALRHGSLYPLFQVALYLPS